MAEIMTLIRGAEPQGLVGRPLNDKAQQHRQQDHQRQRHADGQAGAEIDHDEARRHEHVAVGEVDQAQDAVHHRVADGDQGVLSAQRDAREQDGNSIFHRDSPFSFSDRG